ncbi:MAG: hypothetical protein J5666_01410 [Bacilli bacterium]|nr:hypothetical protein [Bacilli bacterium]
MKKLILGLFLLSICFLTMGKTMYAYSETGHSDFKKIEFVDPDCRLLKNYSQKEINDRYDSLVKKSFGWSTFYFNIEEEASYEGITIFSRANSTSAPISFDYSLKDVTFSQVSVSVSGSVSTKISGSIKKVSLGANADITAKKTTESSTTTESKTAITFKIQPGTKLSMRIIGVCYVTTGVSCYRFFGVRIRRGAWEKIDVDTIIYEIKEETI